MLTAVKQLGYVIVLCDDIDRMKEFYRDLFSFAVDSETDETLALRVGSVLLGLRKRTRDYDGHGGGSASPGLQLAFLVSSVEVDQCYEVLQAKGVQILDPPTDQPRGHRTVYFADPEGNILEVYAEI
ncbi:MAG: VOC family protein [Pirellulaceae bacterium]|nr:VOC family protein [Pirellulaceae bacterium]